MNVHFSGEQSILFFFKNRAVDKRDSFDASRVKSIQNSQINGEYLVDFSRVSEKLFCFEKRLNHILIK